ncbi:uncharacterized protein EV420DRAFT_1750712 [Desarmillaria tabescens]|uniref:F-box domain-containing protein n=1 Tax=Armillaria tabescens TaxID=1929756 RepID=A0AA39JXK9_ARMTA|nr:uncharacterized protein EV420DRAFT_1750712 [Desarmillaria tabescens]KAK0449681.1 hypothetical protein EV420DRAFT_1750712 [Desarmillaria tabescens]
MTTRSSSISNMHQHNYDTPSTLEQMIILKYDGLSSYQRPRTLLNLLRTNAVPSSMEVGILKGSLFHVQNDIRRIVADLNRLSSDGDVEMFDHDVSRQLHNRLVLLEEIERDHRLPLLPIRRIPPEILMEIFLCTASFSGNVLNTNSAPWVIGQVCSSWRSICNSMCPSLWSSIDIFANDRFMRKKDPRSLLGTVLSRSRQYGLAIRLSSSIEPTIWEELLPHAERWTNIHLTDIGQPEMGYLSHLRGRLERLQDCYLEFACEGLEIINVFDHTLALKKIKVYGLEPDTLFLIASTNLEVFVDDRDEWLPSASLVHYHLLKVLQDSPNLTCFYAPYCSRVTSTAGRAVFPRIVKPSLSELTVCDNSLIRSLSLPRLEVAALFNDYCLDLADCLSDFQDMLVQSQCNTLTTLQVFNIRLRPGNLVRIFKLSPALVSFYYQTHEWEAQNDEALQGVIGGLFNSQEFVPQLKDVVLELALFSETDIHCANHRMVEMIVARRGSSLRKFHLAATVPDKGFCDLGEGDIERLRNIKAEGFDVAITSCGSLDVDNRKHIYV